MSDIVTRNSALSVQNKTGGFSVVPDTFAQVMEFATAMSIAGTAIPKHLRGNEGACMAVAMQAFEWGMSPFAVANKSYSVNDRIAYEAQLIAAVVNTRSGIKGRLKYKFTGEGGDLRCEVTGILDGEPATYRSPKFSDITPKNSPLWKSDPEQQLAYYSARAWARRHVPETILGVYDREEMEVDIQTAPPPPPPPVELQNTTEQEKPAKKTKSAPVEEAEIIETKPQKREDPSVSEIATELEDRLSECQTIEGVEEVWSEFDLLSQYQDDEDSQHVFTSIYERMKRRFSSPPKPVFSND